MKQKIYYNEIDPFALAWMVELIHMGLLPEGCINDRTILEEPPDLSQFSVCHFFAGIGGWQYALQNSRWKSSWPIWTGSCPCQPFSAAGGRKVDKDERHLWPRWFELISQYRPATIIGEQVQSADGRIWLAGVFSDLETLGYRTAAMDICAASAGAPHRRQRLYWVADATGSRSNKAREHGSRSSQLSSRSEQCSGIVRVDDAQNCDRRPGVCGAEKGIGPGGKRRRRPAGRGDAERMEYSESLRSKREQNPSGIEPDCGCESGRMADADGRESENQNLQCSGQYRQQPKSSGTRGRMADATGAYGSQHEREPREGLRRPAQSDNPTEYPGNNVGMGHPDVQGLQTPEQEVLSGKKRNAAGRTTAEPSPSFWADSQWIWCKDGKYRRIPASQPSILRVDDGLPADLDIGWIENPFPLTSQTPGRVGLLRGYGNAIVPEVATEFINTLVEIFEEE